VVSVSVSDWWVGFWMATCPVHWMTMHFFVFLLDSFLPLHCLNIKFYWPIFPAVKYPFIKNYLFLYLICVIICLALATILDRYFWY